MRAHARGSSVRGVWERSGCPISWCGWGSISDREKPILADERGSLACSPCHEMGVPVLGPGVQDLPQVSLVVLLQGFFQVDVFYAETKDRTALEQPDFRNVGVTEQGEDPDRGDEGEGQEERTNRGVFFFFLCSSFPRA